MGDDDRIVFHDRPEDAKPEPAPAPAAVPGPSPAPEAVPAPQPAGAGVKVDAFIDEAGRKLSDEERAKANIKMFSKSALRQFVLDLIAELSKLTCEEHVRQIEDLRRKIADLESGKAVNDLKAAIEQEKAGARSDYNTQTESLQTDHQATLKRLRDESEAEFNKRKNEIEVELFRLRARNPQLESELARAQSDLERLNVELAMFQELQRQLGSGKGKTKAELEKIVADLRSRIQELEAELGYFTLEEEHEAEAFAQKAEQTSERLLAKADARSEAIAVGARQAALDARAAAAKFDALRDEMHQNHGSIANIVEMVKLLKEIAAARGVAGLGDNA